MLCQFEKLLYPRDVSLVNADSYMIALYHPCERVFDSAGGLITQIKAVGYCLPITDKLRFDIHGRWKKSEKHGLQYEVENYDEVITPSKEGIISYLSSGQIKGIGPVIAGRIYDAFGDSTLDILDTEPDRLLSIRGISPAKLVKIKESYLVNRAARDVVAFLTPYGITANRAVRFYMEYGNEAIKIVKENPYRLSELSGIGFLTADKIAMSLGFERISVERVDAGMIYTLKAAESRGHLCMEKHDFIHECQKILDTPGLTEEMIANRATWLLHNADLVSYEGNVYRLEVAWAEERLAKRIARLLSSSGSHEIENLDDLIDAEEDSLRIKFAPEQRDAISMALTNRFSIITGGPGTGKTMIQRAIIDIYRKIDASKSICCCAPTGRAARRMEESTRQPASTVHKALGLVAGEDGAYNLPEELQDDLILVDEVSMLDIYLAGYFFDAIKKEAQVVFIGDADQLPSVGPGAVLSEMINCGCIPIARLDKVFRQTAGSRIAINAKLIRHGNLNLEYGTDFLFLDSPDMEESADSLVDLYLREVAAYGVDNVALLSPFRQKTVTGVNALNDRIQEKINPLHSGFDEVTKGNKKFRVGDKVMQTKNKLDVNNGDIGYIRSIDKSGGYVSLEIDFGDGRIKEYDSDDLDMIELGYATTIHKSQGAEYESVIINLQSAHSVMLVRPLIYTAITRGKGKVIIVGERKALCTAIRRTDTERRGTCLAKRIKKIMKRS